ncbi:MAG TPA: M1 family metallopeptidase [Polyangia bacterium]|nr:M1 family metallopeptidase [Polyangia bacterium]
MRRDPHSYADDEQAAVEHLSWDVDVDFESRTLQCSADLRLRGASDLVDLDTRDLTIEAVDDGKSALGWELAEAQPILGARLRVHANGATRVRIRYRTSPTASALQWLTPAQTAGGVQPFLFSQCQAIHARSLVPLQDTPRVRITYDARITAPTMLRSLMAAADKGIEGSIGHWEMPQPIPPYLIAFAVGDLESREVGPRSRVWAEPSVVDAAAWEFAGVDDMLTTAERLFGAYDWERFDILTMPPSFPYGGMENPRLTFLTPTLLAGDRSLVSVVAHELAHSWTGNLVSNASAEHFWLNEGFTVFAERRIVEALYGVDTCALQAAIGRRGLDEAFERFGKKPELTRLRTKLEGIDPDEVFSEIPYEKGYLFLRAIEEAAGREAFDRFLRAYLGEFRFGAIDSDDFQRLVERELPGVLEKVDGKAWLDGAGLPAAAPVMRAKKMEAVEAIAAAGRVATEEEAAEWGATEWELYLTALPRPFAECEALDARFELTKKGNYEVLVAWLTLALASGHEDVVPRAEEVLAKVGRMKYLRPLYGAMIARGGETRKRAAALFERVRATYHPIAQQVVEGLLAAADRSDKT